MNVLLWALKNQHSLTGRIGINVLYYLLSWTVKKEVLVNQTTYHSFIHGLHRVAEPKVLFVLGGMFAAGELAKDLYCREVIDEIWLGGTAKEQEQFLSQFRPPNVVRLPPMKSTKDEARAIARMATERGLKTIGVMTYEIHITRAIFTCIKQAIDAGATVKFVPFAYFDSARPPLIPRLTQFACLVETKKFHHYKNKGDVATLAEAQSYYFQ